MALNDYEVEALREILSIDKEDHMNYEFDPGLLPKEPYNQFEYLQFEDLIPSSSVVCSFSVTVTGSIL